MFQICLVFYANAGESSSNSTTVSTESTTTTIIPFHNETENKNEKAPEPLPTPLALKTFRSYVEHPYTIVKHRSRYMKPRSKPRRRLKFSKPIYGPPNYIVGEPINYYKQQSDHPEFSTTSSLPKIEYETKQKKNKSPVFDLDTEINIQSIPLIDLKKYLPSNNFDFMRNSHYEKQPIPFDLYDNPHSSSEILYGSGFRIKQKDNQEEYHTVNSKIPQIKYQNFPSSQSSFNQPREIYDIPTSISYPSNNPIKSSYFPTKSHDEISFNAPHHSSNPIKPPFFIPAKSNDENIFSISLHSTDPVKSSFIPSNSHDEVQFSISHHSGDHTKPSYTPSESYDEISSSISHSSNTHTHSSYDPPNHSHDTDLKSFAEPPIDVHYTYSTEYEINPIPPSTKIRSYSGPKYLPPDSSDHKTSFIVSNHKEEYSEHSDDETGYFAEPPTHNSHDSFAPFENSDLPLENYEKTTTYDYPKSSYEVPLYGSPSETNSKLQNEYYPPNIPNMHQHTEQSYTTTKNSNNEENDDSSKTATNLIKIKNYRKQSNSSPKPSGPSNFMSDQLTDSLENKTTTFKPQQKRKRTRTPSTSKIHNLDTDELRDAFISETKQISQQVHPSHFQPTPLDPIKSFNLSENEKFRNFYSGANTKNYFSSNNDDYASYAWEPIKIKEANKTIQRLRKKSSLLETTNTSTNHPPMPIKSSELVSMQKSHSQNYYDSTISPEIFKELNRVRKYSKINVRDNSNDFVVLTSNVMVSNGIERNFKLKGSVIDDTVGEINSRYDLRTGEVSQNQKNT